MGTARALAGRVAGGSFGLHRYVRPQAGRPCVAGARAFEPSP